MALKGRVMVMVTVVVVGLALPSVLAHSCTPPFYHTPQHLCVYVKVTSPLNGPGKDVTWKEGRDECLEVGGTLAVLEQVDVFEGVVKYINDNYPDETAQGYNFWVGGSRIGDTWKWVNGHTMNITSPLWLPNHPPVSSTTTLYVLMVPDEAVPERRYLLDAPASKVAPGYVCSIGYEDDHHHAHDHDHHHDHDHSHTHSHK